MQRKKEIEMLIARYRTDIMILQEREEDLMGQKRLIEDLVPNILASNLDQMLKYNHDNAEMGGIKEDLEHLKSIVDEIDSGIGIVKEEKVLLMKRIEKLINMSGKPQKGDEILGKHPIDDAKTEESTSQNSQLTKPTNVKDTDWKNVCKNLQKQVVDLTENLNDSSQKLLESKDNVKNLEEKFAKLKNKLQTQLKMMENEKLEEPLALSEKSAILEDDKETVKEEPVKTYLSEEKQGNDLDSSDDPSIVYVDKPVFTFKLNKTKTLKKTNDLQIRNTSDKSPSVTLEVQKSKAENLSVNKMGLTSDQVIDAPTTIKPGENLLSPGGIQTEKLEEPLALSEKGAILEYNKETVKEEPVKTYLSEEKQGNDLDSSDDPSIVYVDKPVLTFKLNKTKSLEKPSLINDSKQPNSKEGETTEDSEIKDLENRLLIFEDLLHSDNNDWEKLYKDLQKQLKEISELFNNSQKKLMGSKSHVKELEEKYALLKKELEEKIENLEKKTKSLMSVVSDKNKSTILQAQVKNESNAIISAIDSNLSEIKSNKEGDLSNHLQIEPDQPKRKLDQDSDLKRICEDLQKQIVVLKGKLDASTQKVKENEDYIKILEGNYSNLEKELRERIESLEMKTDKLISTIVDNEGEKVLKEENESKYAVAAISDALEEVRSVKEALAQYKPTKDNAPTKAHIPDEAKDKSVIAVRSNASVSKKSVSQRSKAEDSTKSEVLTPEGNLNALAINIPEVSEADPSEAAVSRKSGSKKSEVEPKAAEVAPSKAVMSKKSGSMKSEVEPKAAEVAPSKGVMSKKSGSRKSEAEPEAAEVVPSEAVMSKKSGSRKSEAEPEAAEVVPSEAVMSKKSGSRKSEAEPEAAEVVPSEAKVRKKSFFKSIDEQQEVLDSKASDKIEVIPKRLKGQMPVEKPMNIPKIILASNTEAVHKRETETVIARYKADITALEERKEDLLRNIEIFENLIPTVQVGFVWKMFQTVDIPYKGAPFPQEDIEKAKQYLAHLGSVLEELKQAVEVIKVEEEVINKRIEELETSVAQQTVSNKLKLETTDDIDSKIGKGPEDLVEDREIEFHKLLQSENTDWQKVAQDLEKKIKDLVEKSKESSKKLKASTDYLKNLQESLATLEKEYREKAKLLEEKNQAAASKDTSKEQDKVGRSPVPQIQADETLSTTTANLEKDPEKRSRDSVPSSSIKKALGGVKESNIFSKVVSFEETSEEPKSGTTNPLALENLNPLIGEQLSIKESSPSLPTSKRIEDCTSKSITSQAKISVGADSEKIPSLRETPPVESSTTKGSAKPIRSSQIGGKPSVTSKHTTGTLSIASAIEMLSRLSRSSFAIQTLQGKMIAKDHLIKTMADQLRELAQHHVWEGTTALETAMRAEPSRTFDWDRTALLQYLEGQEPPSITTSQSHVDSSNPLDVKVLRKLGKDSLIIEWGSNASAEIVGFQIFLNGQFMYWVHASKHNVALLYPLDLGSTVEISVKPIDIRGNVNQNSTLVYQPE